MIQHRPPLLSHGFSESAVSPASFSAPSLARTHAMNSILPALNRLYGDQTRQVFKPQARCFGLSVPEHPRLHDLCRLADPRRKYPDRILDSDAVDRSRPQGSYKVHGSLSLLDSPRKSGVIPPTCTGTTDISAGWKGDHQIPAAHRTCRTVKKVQYVTKDMIVGVFTFRLDIVEITGPRFKPTTAESVPYNSTEFAGDQNGRFHALDCTARGVPCQGPGVIL